MLICSASAFTYVQSENREVENTHILSVDIHVQNKTFSKQPASICFHGD